MCQGLTSLKGGRLVSQLQRDSNLFTRILEHVVSYPQIPIMIQDSCWSSGYHAYIPASGKRDPGRTEGTSPAKSAPKAVFQEILYHLELTGQNLATWFHLTTDESRKCIFFFSRFFTKTNQQVFSYYRRREGWKYLGWQLTVFIKDPTLD